MDFHLGEVTRSHVDIDLVTWNRHRKRVRQPFSEYGFVETESSPSSVSFRKHGRDLSTAFILKGMDGEVLLAGFEDGDPLYLSVDSLGGSPCSLNDLTCLVVAVEGLIREKESAQRWIGRPLRSKDVEDLKVLRNLLRRRRPIQRRSSGGSPPTV